MRIEITDAPRENDEAFIIEKTRRYNRAFTEKDSRSPCVFARDDAGSIVGGLTAKTYWAYLEVAYLWVNEKQRGQGHASKLMQAAEAEARARGCKHALLDTFSFQALGFYKKLGYTEFGRLSGFSGRHDRHYLYKNLAEG
jgi:ribosomal protein S18 acetylase RimI-like enzyme